MSTNNCIRVLADPVQIEDCRNSIREIQSHLREAASLLNLAGNEVRLKILFLLRKEQEMCPCDLSDVLDMTVPAISQHLRKMKEGGIVVDRKVGQTIFYSIVDDATGMIKQILDDMLQEIETEIIK